MNIHEYQAKQIFADFGIPVQNGKIIENAENAISAAKEIGGKSWVVKAQIHAGGRGKGGGVKFAKDLEAVGKYAHEILGMNLVTHQTGPEGKLVQKVYIVEAVDIKEEYYLSILLDRATEMPVIIASAEGGMDIEKVAAEMPEKIVKIQINPLIGFRSFHGRMIAKTFNLNADLAKKVTKLVASLYQIYVQKNANMIEVNPLVLTDDDEFIALDAKVGFDDNAMFKHKEIAAMRDFDEEEPTELEADKYGLSYVKLDGNVGCVVNGAGLAMSTMDIVKHENGEPANFLDVGGKATAKTVAKSFEIILKDPNVKAIFVNIFGGIVRCDRIANGILEATQKINVNVPLVIRLDGTNAKEASEILKKANIQNIITAESMSDGAKKVVAAARG